MAQPGGADDDSVDKILTRMHFKDIMEEADLRNYTNQRSQQNQRNEDSERRADDGQGGIGADRFQSSDDSLYDSNDNELVLFEREADEGDEDDEEEDDSNNDDLLHGDPLSGAFVTWNEIAAQQRHMNRRQPQFGGGNDDDEEEEEEEDDDEEDQEMEDNNEEDGDGMMVDDDDEDEDSEEDLAQRANRMQVVNAAGQVLGAYLPPRAMQLGDAYNHLNPPPPPPAFLKQKVSRDDVPAATPYEKDDRQATAAKSNKRPREDNDDREFNSLTSLIKELHVDANDPAMKTLLEKASGRTEQDHSGGRKRARIDLTNAGTSSSSSPESMSDNDYISKHFADFLKSSRITAKQLCDLFCPTCGFGNLINEEPVRADVYDKIQKIMEVGVMTISIETTAFIVSELWNDGIYRPMKAANKRMLPLTYKMAYEHLTRPHRPDPRPDHRADIEMLTTTAKNASALIFYQDSITSRIRYDPKAYNMMASALRLKNILRKTLPEKMAYYNPRLEHNNAAATGLVNPMRTVRYASTGTASAMGKTKNSGLGGRQVSRK